MSANHLVIRAGSNYLPIAVASAVPAAPTGLAAVNSGFASRNDLTWVAASGATSYAVERSPHGAGTWAAVTFPAVIAGTSWLDPGLSASTAYDYRVRAVGPGGTSAPSGTATATTAAAGAAPANATQFNAVTFSASSVNTAWTVGAGATYYALWRSLDGATYLPVGVTAAPPYRDAAGLAGGTTYYYRHYAGAAGGEAYTDPLIPDAVTAGGYGAIPTWPSGAPTIPSGALGDGYPNSSGLSASAVSSSGVQVRWNGVQAPEGVEASYVLQRSPDDSTWAQIAAPAAGTWSYQDDGLTAATTYHYRLGATGAGGTSAFSASVAATTESASGGRRLLRPGDFTYLGAFTPPFYADPGNSVLAGAVFSGITLRYVAGNVHFFGLSDPNQTSSLGYLYEWTPPSQGSWAASPPFPAGTLVTYWGNPYNGKRLGLDNPANGQPLNSFGTTQCRDETTDGQFNPCAIMVDATTAGHTRLYHTYGNWYNVGGLTSPDLLRYDLTDGANTIATTGPYRLDEHAANAPNCQKTVDGLTPIPQWFADASLNAISGAGTHGDPWMAMGFGGNQAGLNFASMGPSIVAVNLTKLPGKECAAGDIPYPSDAGILYETISSPDTNRHTPLIPSVSLCGYIVTSYWATRPPGLQERVPAGDAYFRPDTNNTGYFYATDLVRGGGCWVDHDPSGGATGHHGVIVMAGFGMGWYDYKGMNVFTAVPSGGQACDGGKAIGLAIIDPADLAAVASGSAGMQSVPLRPANWWLPPMYGADARTLPFTGNFSGDLQGVYVSGMAFDPATGYLYVSVCNQYVPSGHLTAGSLIHVFQLAMT